MVKDPPANAEDMSLVPGLGGFHLLWGATATEPACLQPALYSQRDHCDKSVLRSESSPCLLQLEEARVQQQRPSAARNKVK